jgi:lipopolysaccharide export system permease protein
VKVLDRYILVEFAKVITVATLTLIGIFFGTVEFKQILEVMSKLGLPWDTLMLVDALQLPLSITYCLPAAVVCAASLVWIRQHQSSEILALQVCGISPQRIFMPFLAIGILAGVVGFVAGDMVAPRSRYLSQKLLLARINNSERPFPGKSEIILKDSKQLRQWMIFGDSIGNSTQPFVALDFTGPAGPVVVYAKSALWTKGVWDLSTGFLCEVPSDGVKGLTYKFGKMQIQGLKPIVHAVESAPKSTFDKTISELRDDIDKRFRAKKEVPPEMLLQLYRRYSQPLSCFFLLLAAAPLTLFRKARHSTTAQYIYVGLLVSLFFLLQDVTYAMGENARLAPLLAAFLPSAILCLGGLGAGLLMRRA